MRAHRRIGKPCDQGGGIVEMQTDILKLLAFNGGEGLGHAVDEWLDSKNADVAPLRGLRNHRFAAAKADFQHDTGDRHRKQRRADPPAPDAKGRSPAAATVSQTAAPGCGRSLCPLRRPKNARGCFVVAIHRCHAAQVAGIHVFQSSRNIKDAHGRHKAGQRQSVEWLIDQRTARLSASARSVRSQEKPPSFSGARPKWP